MSPEEGALLRAAVRMYLRERRTGVREDAERERLACEAAEQGPDVLRRIELAMKGSVGL